LATIEPREYLRMTVDRMRMTSEKYFSGGKAVMEIDRDRANPDADQYTIDGTESAS
jgi:hypothetical protein